MTDGDRQQLLPGRRPHPRRPRRPTAAGGWWALLAERSGVDAQRIWEWGYLERVSTGLHVRDLGAQRAAEPFLRTAALLLE